MEYILMESCMRREVPCNMLPVKSSTYNLRNYYSIAGQNMACILLGTLVLNNME